MWFKCYAAHWYLATNESFTYLSILTIPKNPEYYDFSKIQFVIDMYETNAMKG